VEDTLQPVNTYRKIANLLKQFVELLFGDFQNCRRA
jgi:hypothetical protein